VATAAGVLLAINPWLGAAALGVWVLVAAISRYASLASLAAALAAPLLQALVWGVEPALLAIGAMGLLLVWRHAGNIRKLLAGTEGKLGQKAPSHAPAAAASHVPHHGAAAPHHPRHKKGRH
jgi:glycerol-3-phosphate acyltransferase PlsY